MGEFGDKFRKAREKKELSLDDVSNVTKIGARMLHAIEEERFDQLPGGVFNKGFIRAYAKHLGLNDEEAVTDYLACLRQAQIDAHEVWEPQRGATTGAMAPVKPCKVETKLEPKKPAHVVTAVQTIKSQPSPPAEELPELQLPRAEDIRPRQRDRSEDSSPGIPWRIIGITATVVILAVMLWTRRSHNPNTAAASTSAAKPVSATLEPAKVEQVKVEQVQVGPTKLEGAKAVPASAGASPKRVESKPASQSSPASAAAPTPAHDSEPGSGAQKNGDDKNDAIVRTFAKTNPQPGAKEAAALTLVIRATETSWISVTADGQPASHETLIAPAHASIRANREIVARVGNAAGVTFVWNGQEVPADGAESEVKTFVFDSSGMRVVPSTPPATQNR